MANKRVGPPGVFVCAVAVLAAVLLPLPPMAVRAGQRQQGQQGQQGQQPQAGCGFVLGFATLRALVGEAVVGECLEDEHYHPDNGEALQATTGGLLVWRKADNGTAFTDGYRTWINGPFGLQQRLNSDRFDWEADASAGAPPVRTPTPVTPGQQCGQERWAVKTLSDPAATAVDFTPRPTTIDTLRALPAPSPAVGFSTPRLAGRETVTYTLTATLARFKLEDDHDIHLVIADPTNTSLTMIAEFPDTGCSGAAASAQRDAMAAARASLVAACGTPVSTRFTNLTGAATIRGVAFFDRVHDQSGVAPNGIELHPVLGIADLTC